MQGDAKFTQNFPTVSDSHCSVYSTPDLPSRPAPPLRSVPKQNKNNDATAMLSALRSRAASWRQPPPLLRLFSSTGAAAPAATAATAAATSLSPMNLLELGEVEAVLHSVRAGDVRVFPVRGKSGGGCTDYMVIATGRSDWHVRNIAQALLFKIKEKQKGSDRKLMPSVQGQQSGKWIVIDSGSIIIHALEERAREYYDLESIWTKEVSSAPGQELEASLVKIRRRDNSQKLMKSI